MFTFYNVKTRTSVEVDEKDMRKAKYVRRYPGGKSQTRYAVRTTVDKTNLTKFVSKEVWDALNVPEEKLNG